MSGRRRVVGICVIAMIMIAGCDRLSGSIDDLAVGDCFDEHPTQERIEVSAVQHHPCSDPHTAEVFFVGEMSGDDDTYPSDDAFLEYFEMACIPAFAAYTGAAYDGVTVRIGSLLPTYDRWGDGHREVTCYAYNADGSTFTRSIKAPD